MLAKHEISSYFLRDFGTKFPRCYKRSHLLQHLHFCKFSLAPHLVARNTWNIKTWWGKNPHHDRDMDRVFLHGLHLCLQSSILLHFVNKIHFEIKEKLFIITKFCFSKKLNKFTRLQAQSTSPLQHKHQICP